MKWQGSFFLRGAVWLMCLCIFGFSSGTTIQEQRETSYKKERSNHYLKYQWASVAPCTTALRLYQEIADSVSAPESLRALSTGALGEYYYITNDYKMAAQLFESAFKISKTPQYRQLQVLALFQTDDRETVHSILDKNLSEKGKEHNIFVNFFQGLTHLKRNDFVTACSSFSRCGQPDMSLPLTIEALSAKQFCSEKLGRTEDVQRYREQLKKYAVTKYIDWTSESIVFQQATVTENVSNESFTVQVGAFASKDNAYALQKKLTEKFRDVTVATVTLEDKVLYRVRIGNFLSRDLAEKFVVDSVQKVGLNAKVVPQ